jgi:glycosyltransferase involved in cell wall biosynthesis
MKKICFVATIPAAVNSFLRDHIQAAGEIYSVTVVCNSEDKYLLEGLNAKIVFLPIERKPSPLKDLLALIRLVKLFRQEKFDIVHSHLPKTGLLGMIAAWLACVPIRINTFHGEVWATQSGWRRIALKLCDQFVGLLATNILVVSPSQQYFLVKEGILPQGKSKLIGAGSICGVNPLRFHTDLDARLTVRKNLGVTQEATVILFVGRLNRDKGILDLASAFDAISKHHSNVVLLLVGSEEDVAFSQIQEICHAELDRLQYVTFTTTPEHYMAAADIFCLPSYREGLPMTILESAACGVPTVASRIYGITDAVEEGKTGLLFTAGDISGLTQSLSTLIEDKSLRQQMGEAARLRVLDLFPSHKITEGVLALYAKLLAERYGD